MISLQCWGYFLYFDQVSISRPTYKGRTFMDFTTYITKQTQKKFNIEISLGSSF